MSKCFVRGFSDIHKMDKKMPRYDFAAHRINSLAMHLVLEAFIKINTEIPSIQDCHYPVVDFGNIKGYSKTNISKFNLPKRYACIPPGFTSPVREWKPKHINEVIDYLLSKDITPVFIGKYESHNGANHVIKPTFQEEINFHKGINLIDKCTLVETAKIIDEAIIVVGLDNGLAHITGCTKTPQVIGYTSVYPKHRLPYRTHPITNQTELGAGCEAVALTRDELNCSGCQSKNLFLYNFDMKGCYEKHFKCLDMLDGNKYIKAIDKILSNYSNYKKV